MTLTPRFLLTTVTLCALGTAGGWLAVHLYLPLPWMIGSLAITALIVMLGGQAPLRPFITGYKFPNDLRSLFVALIGVMIGTQVTPELMAQAPGWAVTLTALLVFIFSAHAGNFLIFRHIGGYSRETAFYSGTPGGLMESILFGEQAGADVRILTAQQFLRIIFVITLLPLGLSIWFGTPVGSASGESLGSPAPVDLLHVLSIMGIAVLGLALARLVRLPAAQLTGPLLLAAAISLSGQWDLHLPNWMIAMAQVVIGMSLGLRFEGTDAALLKRCVWLSLMSVTFMLTLGATFAIALNQITQLGFLPVFISFAPGGVAEMSIVALSLAASPAMVSLHHIARILMTVAEMMALGWLLGMKVKR